MDCTYACMSPLVFWLTFARHDQRLRAFTWVLDTSSSKSGYSSKHNNPNVGHHADSTYNADATISSRASAYRRNGNTSVATWNCQLHIHSSKRNLRHTSVGGPNEHCADRCPNYPTGTRVECVGNIYSGESRCSVAKSGIGG